MVFFQGQALSSNTFFQGRARGNGSTLCDSATKPEDDQATLATWSKHGGEQDHHDEYDDGGDDDGDGDGDKDDDEYNDDGDGGDKDVDELAQVKNDNGRAPGTRILPETLNQFFDECVTSEGIVTDDEFRYQAFIP